MIVKEITAKSILSTSKVMDYSLNPYIGCGHGCTYCYARYMKRFTGHTEQWGKFVDVKINAPELLQHEIRKKKTGRVWVSGTCDPYQPLEKQYRLTQQCLEILSAHSWPVTIQTKSPLVSRDLELLKSFPDLEVGVSIATGDEEIRRVFEPDSPSINERILTVKNLKCSGLRTFVMVAPMLPKARELVRRLRGKVDYVLVDKMNYHHADHIYRKHGMEYALTYEHLIKNKQELADAFDRARIPHEFLY